MWQRPLKYRVFAQVKRGENVYKEIAEEPVKGSAAVIFAAAGVDADREVFALRITATPKEQWYQVGMSLFPSPRPLGTILGHDGNEV